MDFFSTLHNNAIMQLRISKREKQHDEAQAIFLFFLLRII